jgi:hypothetical protein
MVSISGELKERNILNLILIVRFACATLDVGHPMHPIYGGFGNRTDIILFTERSFLKILELPGIFGCFDDLSD